MLDLFKTNLPDSKLHKNFISIRDEKYSFGRDLLISWTNDFVDRDNKFVNEFQTTFNSSFWELYLFNVFKQYNFTIDFSKSTPDFIIQKPEKVCCEAVISNNAYDALPEYERSFNSKIELKDIVDTATIRLANAIIYKYSRKYNDIYSKLDYVKGNPFILAVAPFEQPFFWEQTNRAILRVLYGIDGFEYSDPNNHIAPNIVKCKKMPFIEKPNGSEIPLGFFSDNQMEEVSAVLFSNVATYGKIRALTKDQDPRNMNFFYSKINKNGWHPSEGIASKNNYSESLDSGLTLYLNPFAKKPLSEDFIKLFPAWSSFDFSIDRPIGDAIDGNLINRMVEVTSFI